MLARDGLCAGRRMCRPGGQSGWAGRTWADPVRGSGRAVRPSVPVIQFVFVQGHGQREAQEACGEWRARGGGGMDVEEGHVYGGAGRRARCARDEAANDCDDAQLGRNRCRTAVHCRTRCGGPFRRASGPVSASLPPFRPSVRGQSAASSRRAARLASRAPVRSWRRREPLRGRQSRGTGVCSGARGCLPPRRLQSVSASWMPLAVLCRVLSRVCDGVLCVGFLSS